MGWLNVDEAAFYGVVWLLGFLSATFSLLDHADSKPLAKCVYFGSVSGFLSFATVSLFVGRIDGPIVGHWYYLGVATVIGLSAKQAEQLRERLFSFILSQKIVLRDKDDSNDH